MDPDWFTTKRVADGLFLTTEDKFFEGNRSNIWLVKGPGKDVVIDCGLGVCDLRAHLERQGLLDNIGAERQCEVVCTHSHFDHSGGAHHFQNVFVHEDDAEGVSHGRQVDTLNYVKTDHFYSQPYPNFSPSAYKVPATTCSSLRDGDMIDLGSGHHLEILHVPGHTKESIAVYYPQTGALFTGDFVYECGVGSGLLDWLPTSCVRDYIGSANNMLTWMSDHDVTDVYPGHFRISQPKRIEQLLYEYVEAKDNGCSRASSSCLQGATWMYFLMGCFRCCPC